VEEDLVNPVCGDLFNFPHWCFLQELVDFAVDLVEGVCENGQAV